MKATQHIAFLCGNFTVKKTFSSISIESLGWTKIEKTEDELFVLKKFFYPEFVDFCFPCKDVIKKKQQMERYTISVNEEIEVSIAEGKTQKMMVKDIRLYVLPMSMLIYSIQVLQDGSLLDDITFSLSKLRNISGYTNELIESKWGEIMQPIVNLFKATALNSNMLSEDKSKYLNLVENGNKLKLFQLINLETKLDEIKQEELLFELGSLAPVGSYGRFDFSSPSKEYFEKTMRKNKISVFNNWNGLSLFDTFSILSYGINPRTLQYWIDSYFDMIYIHSLFLKFYLFRMNVRFKNRVEKISNLENEFLTFERDFCFHKISYNFLPLIIHNHLDIGLEINEEKNQLYRLIEQERNVQERESDKKMNNFLLFITCLTIFSAIWDLGSLFNEISPYEDILGSTTTGFRLVTTLLLFMVLLVILIFRIPQKRK